jgi:lipoprotein-releasing system permease protein
MSGFHEDLQTKILGVNAHIVTLNYRGRIADYEAVMEKINRTGSVHHSAPFIYGQVMLRSGRRALGVIARGIDPDRGLGTTDILENLTVGSVDGLRNPEGIPGIIIGKELLRNLALFVGDEIDMISPISEMGPLGMMPRMKKFRVVGYFEAGMYEYDSSLAFIDLKAAQDFFRYDDAVTGIEVNIADLYNAQGVAEEIEQMLGPPFYTRDWQQMNRNLFSALKLEKIVMFIILTLIILVASFNIIGNLIMIVIEKSREIAIMKAMGATSRGIMVIFMLHGLVIGMAGTLFGVAGGYGLCQLLKSYRFINLPADVYYLSYLPVKMSIFDFTLVPAAAIVITFVATIYPSWKAARVDPVQPLRYE